MLVLPRLINFALATIKTMGIDESHGLSHAFNVLHHSHNILESEIKTHPFLDNQREIIYTSSLVHDLCDQKYTNEYYGIAHIHRHLITQTSLLPEEAAIVEKIISTMSYSKVKKDGFPTNLGNYRMAYHIVREADLLSAYDFDRSIIYNMNQVDPTFQQSMTNAIELFDSRVLRHNQDGLFITDYSKLLSKELEKDALERMDKWKSILHNQNVSKSY
jgi:hypothetical protein